MMQYEEVRRVLERQGLIGEIASLAPLSARRGRSILEYVSVEAKIT
jgi:hypothetical protein